MLWSDFDIVICWVVCLVVRRCWLFSSWLCIWRCGCLVCWCLLVWFWWWGWLGCWWCWWLLVWWRLFMEVVFRGYLIVKWWMWVVLVFCLLVGCVVGFRCWLVYFCRVLLWIVLWLVLLVVDWLSLFWGNVWNILL